jgi:ribosomal RNA-processing protein 12
VVQKKCYKVLAYICEQRPDFLEAHFQDVLDALMAGMPSSVSAAKRNRLRCLKAAVLAMARPDGPMAQPAGDDAGSRDDATKQVGLPGFSGVTGVWIHPSGPLGSL